MTQTCPDIHTLDALDYVDAAPDDIDVDDDRFEDFRELARIQLRTWDVDPVYPLLRRVYEKRGLPQRSERALWYTLIYVNWYWVHSCEHVWDQYPEPERVALDVKLRSRKERRCIQPGDGQYALDFINHWADIAADEGLINWVERHVGDGGRDGWRRVRDAFEETPYAGGWASYKFADILRYTHGYPITADDMGTGAGSDARGPIRGLQLLTDEGLESFSDVTDAHHVQDAFFAYCRANGIPFQGIEQLETCICNYVSTTRELYYAGSDLDDMQEQLDGVPPVWWEARRELYPDQLLGELWDWHGKSRRVRGAFADDGIIRWWRHGLDGRPAFENVDWVDFPWDTPGYSFEADP